ERAMPCACTTTVELAWPALASTRKSHRASRCCPPEPGSTRSPTPASPVGCCACTAIPTCSPPTSRPRSSPRGARGSTPTWRSNAAPPHHRLRGICSRLRWPERYKIDYLLARESEEHHWEHPHSQEVRDASGTER